MILNSAEEKSLESLLVDKGVINAVKCRVCHNLTAFEDGDIVYINQLVGTPPYQVIGEKGYIKCPWCGNEMHVAERQDSAIGKVITRKYFSTIEGKEYDETKYEIKNGRDVEKV